MLEPPSMPARIYSEPELGAIVRFSRTITEADVSLFIGVTWDVNPYHTDDNFVQQTPISRRIVPGLLTASMLTHLGGLWGLLAYRMDLEFVAPVYIGETITAECRIVEIDAARNKVRMKAQCINSAGNQVLVAEIHGYPSKIVKIEAPSA